MLSSLGVLPTRWKVGSGPKKGLLNQLVDLPRQSLKDGRNANDHVFQQWCLYFFDRVVVSKSLFGHGTNGTYKPRMMIGKSGEPKQFWEFWLDACTQAPATHLYIRVQPR